MHPPVSLNQQVRRGGVRIIINMFLFFGKEVMNNGIYTVMLVNIVYVSIVYCRAYFGKHYIYIYIYNIYIYIYIYIYISCIYWQSKSVRDK